MKKQEAFTPTTLTRIGSISKAVTALGIMRLVEQGKFNIEQPAWEVLKLDSKTLGASAKQITARHLLQHSVDWEKEVKSGFPNDYPAVLALMKASYPVPRKVFVDWAFSQSHQINHGIRFDYANINFMALAEIIERQSGMTYEAFIKKYVLAPAGITRMKLGKTRIEEQDVNEAHYYADDKSYPSCFPQDKGRRVERPYGVFSIETTYGAGGWIGSVIDLARIICIVDQKSSRCAVERKTFEAMMAPPSFSHRSSAEQEWSYYGSGWNVGRNTDGLYAFSHGGSTPGACCHVIDRYDGYGIAAVFNGARDEGSPASQAAMKLQNNFNQGMKFSPVTYSHGMRIGNFELFV